MSKIPKNNGVAQAALGRKPTTMKHRNAQRGGARNEQADISAETQDEFAEDDADVVIAEDATEDEEDEEDEYWLNFPTPWDLDLSDDNDYGDDYED